MEGGGGGVLQIAIHKDLQITTRYNLASNVPCSVKYVHWFFRMKSEVCQLDSKFGIHVTRQVFRLLYRCLAIINNKLSCNIHVNEV